MSPEQLTESAYLVWVWIRSNDHRWLWYEHRVCLLQTSVVRVQWRSCSVTELIVTRSWEQLAAVLARRLPSATAATHLPSIARPPTVCRYTPLGPTMGLWSPTSAGHLSYCSIPVRWIRSLQ